MTRLSRFTPFALLRRHRVSREQERALRLAEVQKEIAVKAIFEAGREHERRLIGAAT